MTRRGARERCLDERDERDERDARRAARHSSRFEVTTDLTFKRGGAPSIAASKRGARRRELDVALVRTKVFSRFSTRATAVNSFSTSVADRILDILRGTLQCVFASIAVASFRTHSFVSGSAISIAIPPLAPRARRLSR